MLQTQCRRLEAQHYSLSLTAEQLSHSMAVSGRHMGTRNANWLLVGGEFLKKSMVSFTFQVWIQGHPYQASFEGKSCS